MDLFKLYHRSLHFLFCLVKKDENLQIEGLGKGFPQNPTINNVFCSLDTSSKIHVKIIV